MFWLGIFIGFLLMSFIDTLLMWVYIIDTKGKEKLENIFIFLGGIVNWIACLIVTIIAHIRDIKARKILKERELL